MLDLELNFRDAMLASKKFTIKRAKTGLAYAAVKSVADTMIAGGVNTTETSQLGLSSFVSARYVETTYTDIVA